jgi:TonB-linked SusC/RagA family outer membrane protein
MPFTFCNPRLARLTKTLLVMRLTAIFLLASALHVSATGITQQTVTYAAKDASLRKIFFVIKKQTGYKFFYDDADLKGSRPVTVNLKNESLESALNKVLNGQPIQYRIEGKTIFITKKLRPSASTGSHTLSPPIDVKGRVVDEKGVPITGASVQIKGTANGTTTDKDGKFSIEVEEGAVLEISSIGFAKKEIIVNGSRELSVSLAVNSSVLDEVQYIAYGQTTRRFSTGNSATVKASDIEKQPVNNPLLALQGRVPGLFIAQTSGIAGSDIVINVQGQNSIANGNTPLYVIDGIPFYQFLPQTGLDNILGSAGFGGESGSAGNPLSYINPADIESIDVLKDADATAIYGSRAANGAILITTKKGKPGKTKLDFTVQYGWGKVTRKLDMLSTRQYLDTRYEAYKNDNIDISTLDADGSNYDIKLWDTTRYTDWQKTLIGNTAKYTNVNSSISGGSEAIQYTVGGTYQKETTVFPLPDQFANQKIAAHINLNMISINGKLRFALSTNYMVDNNRLPDLDLTQQAVQLEPVAPSLFNEDGTLNWKLTASGNSTWDNPLAVLYSNYKNKTNNLLASATLSYEIVEGLSLSSSFGYTNLQTDDFKSTSLLAIRPEERAFTQRYAGYGNRLLNSWIVEPQAAYKQHFGEGRLEALLGFTIQQNNAKGGHVYGLGYNSDDVMENMQAAASLTAGLSFLNQYKYNAAFARLNYILKDKYIANFTARRDGSSRFGPQNRFHNFGSAAVAWIFSEENFIKSAFRFMSFGKVRMSYGTTGNDQINNYNFLSLYDVVNYGGLAYQGATGLAPTGISNPYLQWELTRKAQFGMDLGFFKDKVLLNASYSINRSSNQLLPQLISSVTGFGVFTNNFPATVQNTSWEFTLNTTTKFTDNFTWTNNVNFTLPQNKLVKFPNLETSSYASRLVIGQPLNIMKVFHFTGVNPQTGIYEFESKTDPVNPQYPEDATVIISTLPKYYGAIESSFRYKKFQLDVLLQGVKQIGTSVYYSNTGIPGPGSFRRGQSNQPVTVLDRWQKPGDVKPIQKYGSDPFDMLSSQVSQVLSSDAAYADASFVRLKNVSLSWQLPAIRNLKQIEICSLFVHAQNLLTFTKYQGLDPENQGIAALPPLKVITVGIQMSL